jgi:hypothetical protein
MVSNREKGQGSSWIAAPAEEEVLRIDWQMSIGQGVVKLYYLSYQKQVFVCKVPI